MATRDSRPARAVTQERESSPLAKPPEGTVTFLFTDIEGSTRLATDLGDERWADLLGVHFRILRDAFAGGYEVSTEGDAIFVSFADAPEALRAAVVAQQAMETHPWEDDTRIRVRIGLHTGEAVLRDGNYVGLQVHQASRVSDAAHGGQILLSEATATLVQNALSPGIVLADLGLYRLKDLGEPQRLFAVEAPDLPRDFPPPRSLEAFPNNLPLQRSAFVGRKGEIATVRALLKAHSLVTLTGVGGGGKTRLALQVAAEELDRYPDGAFFADLAAVADPDLVPRAVAEALGVQLGGGGSTRSDADLLVDVLARRHFLLVLDNCEHLLDACAELADRIHTACPEMRILATSREPLEVDGEQVHRVPSLSLPEEGTDGSGSEAVQLFVDRARAARSDFALTPDDVPAVVQISRRLDGIPLAIEFAAARVTHLSTQQIAHRLDERFRLLTGGRRRVRRQQTLQAALDWSYDLLDDSEQRVLRCLGVFVGSFGLEMAEEMCSGEDVDRTAVLDVIGSLVDKSLVATETTDGQVRYRLLETVRSYVEAKLIDAGEAERYRSRHRDAYLAWLERTPWVDLFFDRDVVSVLARELSNLRAALEWSQAEGRRDLVARLAARPIRLWIWEGHGHEGVRWLEWALEAPEDLDPLDRAACHVALANALTTELRASEMETHAARAIELGGEELGGLLVQAYGLRAEGVSFRFFTTGDSDHAREARRLAEEGIRIARDIGGPWPTAAFLHHGYTMWVLDDVAAAERSFSAVLEEASGRVAPTAMGAAVPLSVCRTLLGDFEGAIRAARWALDNQPPGLREWSENFLAIALAQVHLDQKAGAAANLEEAIRIAEAGGVYLELNECLLYTAAIAYETGDAPTASRLLAAAVSIGDAASASIPLRTPASYALYLHYLPRIRDALDPEESRRRREEGEGMTRDEASAAALEVVERLRTEADPPT